MSSRLTFDAQLAQQTQEVTLGEARYIVRMTWRARLRGWYLDLFDADGVQLVAERRLEAGWGPLWGLAFDGAPTVTLVVIGPQHYTQADLGAGLEVLTFALDELPPVVAGPAEVRLELLEEEP